MLFSRNFVFILVHKQYRSYFSTYKYRMSTSPPVKKLHTMSKTIGTHNGTFHCDEVLACSMLRILPEYKDSEIFRSRDPAILEKCDIVVDVGGVYDPTIHRYDHHQRSFNESMSSIKAGKPWVTKLSSAGLVYCHFGHRVLSQVLNIPLEDPVVEAVYDKVYKNFIEEIDAIDNGISTHDGTPRYIITTNLSRRVGNLNPSWKEPSDDESMRKRFNKAMELVLSEFLDRINNYYNVWWPARTTVKDAIEKRFEVDPSGEILELEHGGVPWKMHFFALEQEMALETPIKYVIYPDTSRKYRVQCIPVEETSFENRLSLPGPWRGVRDEQLADLINLPGAIFVHANGFIGGHNTRDGALTMARRALKFTE